MYINLDLAKKHLNIDSDFILDDLYILDLITVAEDVVSRNLNIALKELEAGGQLPPAIIQAMLLLIGNFYANREPVSYGIMAKIPLSFEYLISLYRKY